MKFSNRLFRTMSALAITGIVAAQIPTRSSVSLAQDSYDPQRLTVAQALLGGGAAYLALKAAGVNLGVRAGGLYTISGLSAASLASFIQANPTLTGVSDALGILVNAGITEFDLFDDLFASAGAVDLGLSGASVKPVGTSEATTNANMAKGSTIFMPTNESLVKALGAEKVALLQKTEQKEQAKAFILANTVVGRFKMSDLTEMAKAGKGLPTVGGSTVVFKMEGNKVMANGAEVLGNEVSTKEAMIITTNGVVNPE